MIRRRRSSGAALVEAVVMLPVLLVLLLGARWLVLRHEAELRSAAMARTCAWALASVGCPDRVPPECAGAIVRRAPGSRWNGPAHGGGDWLSDAVFGIPIVRDALAGILPSRVAVQYEVDLRAGLDLDKRVLRLTGFVAVPCNAKPNTERVLKRVLDAATGGVL